jgi:methylenetetrahydrofolate dehydrogenase (NADP+) / methenyltetrahydrofolate cyclohydrolase
MTAKIIDGKTVAEEIRSQVVADIDILVKNGKQKPGLATVLIGDNPASQVYVRMKQKACEEVGIESRGYELPANAREEEIEKLIHELNRDPKINGILVELPLPAGLDEERILNAVSIEKDVDGFHPLNIGRLAQKGRDPLFLPCTPAGVMYLLSKEMPSMEGINAVVLGRSNIVGMPVALLLVRTNATVTICHSHSRNLPDIVRSADVLVAAVGKPQMVRGDWVKPGAIVIDVGINRVEDPSRKSGYRLDGDVAFDEVKEMAGAITPVPGGVGPMTTAMLLSNTMRAVKLANK